MDHSWISTMQQGMGLLAKAGILAWMGMAPIALRKGVRWVQQHTTASERATLRQLGQEAWVYVESVFAHLPTDSKVEEAVRYAMKVAEAWGLAGSMKEIHAAVMLGMRNSQTPSATDNGIRA